MVPFVYNYMKIRISVLLLFYYLGMSQVYLHREQVFFMEVSMFYRQVSTVAHRDVTILELGIV